MLGAEATAIGNVRNAASRHGQVRSAIRLYRVGAPAPGGPKELIADYQNGQSTPALVNKYGIAKGTVLNLRKEHGITMRRQHMTEEEVAEAIKLYQQGWSLARVGQHINRNPSTIQGLLRRGGVAGRQRWERGSPR